MKKNDQIILEITAMSSEGSGIGRHEGIAVFVPLTAIGDIAEVLILKVKPNLAFGKLIRIITPSPDREENTCPAFSKCGGCVYRHISYSKECEIKQKRVEDAILRIGGIDKKAEHINYGTSQRYRNKAQYPVNENGSCGFFANHSHRIIPCEDCHLQPVEFAKISRVFEDFIKEKVLKEAIVL